MFCTPKTDLKSRRMRRQAIAIACLVCIIVVSLLSEAFIQTYMSHVHDHNGAHGSCAACAQIRNAENFLRLLGAAAALGLTFFAGYRAAATLVTAICSDTATPSPITAKTRMNN